MFGLSKSEIYIFKKLDTPIKIQDFLDKFPINWEEDNDNYMSPRKVLEKNKMDCLEGALFAAVALWVNGQKPLILDLQANGDVDHTIALYKINGFWGAISKTNHAVLRFRDPVYKTLRELALSYFHEYFDNKTKKKSLRRFSSKPFDLSKLGIEWVTSSEDLGWLMKRIDSAPHTNLFPKKNVKYLRSADQMEIRAGKITEWKRQ